MELKPSLLYNNYVIIVLTLDRFGVAKPAPHNIPCLSLENPHCLCSVYLPLAESDNGGVIILISLPV